MIKTFVFTLVLSTGLAQTIVPIKDLKLLKNDVFQAIQPYQIIWIGEMHGANEPAQFAESIVGLLRTNKQKVTFGFEIKEADIPKQVTSVNLVNSTFGKTYENRATIAWQHLILKMEGDKRIKTFYFDENDEQISGDERDSLMAVNILKKWDQKSTLVLLSGNLHNMQEPRNGSTKAAFHLLQMLNNSFKMLSLTHRFKKGQIATKVKDKKGNLEFRDFDFSASWSMQKSMYQQNHLFISDTLSNGWNGHFFTESATPSSLINCKN